MDLKNFINSKDLSIEKLLDYLIQENLWEKIFYNNMLDYNIKELDNFSYCYLYTMQLNMLFKIAELFAQFTKNDQNKKSEEYLIFNEKINNILNIIESSDIIPDEYILFVFLFINNFYFLLKAFSDVNKNITDLINIKNIKKILKINTDLNLNVIDLLEKTLEQNNGKSHFNIINEMIEYTYAITSKIFLYHYYGEDIKLPDIKNNLKSKKFLTKIDRILTIEKNIDLLISIILNDHILVSNIRKMFNKYLKILIKMRTISDENNSPIISISYIPSELILKWSTSIFKIFTYVNKTPEIIKLLTTKSEIYEFLNLIAKIIDIITEYNPFIDIIIKHIPFIDLNEIIFNLSNVEIKNNNLNDINDIIEKIKVFFQLYQQKI